MQENKQLRISFGVLSPSLASQLKEQAFKFDKEEVKHFDTLRESINYLTISDLITDTVRAKATQKLFNRIRLHVMKLNKLKIVAKK